MFPVFVLEWIDDYEWSAESNRGETEEKKVTPETEAGQGRYEDQAAEPWPKPKYTYTHMLPTALDGLPPPLILTLLFLALHL